MDVPASGVVVIVNVPEVASLGDSTPCAHGVAVIVGMFGAVRSTVKWQYGPNPLLMYPSYAASRNMYVPAASVFVMGTEMMLPEARAVKFVLETSVPSAFATWIWEVSESPSGSEILA